MRLTYLPVSLMCVASLLPKPTGEQQPPFAVSLKADCYLSGTPYKLLLDRTSPATTRVVFRREDGKRPPAMFEVAGIMDGFDSMGPDLMLNFVNPGPTTRVYSEVDGNVRQNLECTSRFGGTRLSVYPGHAIGCFQGEKLVGNVWVPVTVQVYVREENGYRMVREVPFGNIYEELQELQKRLLSSFESGR